MNATPFIPGQAGSTAAQQQTSLTDAINGGVEFAYDEHRDLAGWGDVFSLGNMAGVMMRVAATGTTVPPKVKNWGTWTAADTKIAHNLGYIPMGWIVTYKSKACDVFAGSIRPDEQFVYLTITDDTADTNLFIF